MPTAARKPAPGAKKAPRAPKVTAPAGTTPARRKLRPQPDPSPDSTGARFEKARRRRGLTQDQVASALKVGRVYVNNIERGRRIPTLDKLHEYATALGWAPSELDPRLK